MTKKTFKELKRQVATLQKQNKMLEEELQRIRLRISQDPNSTDFDSKYKRQEYIKTKDTAFNESEYSEDSSNYSSLADFNADLSNKISVMQKQLSKALLENAKLKKSISYVEAENANLITENHELKWKVESLSKDSDILSEKESETDSIKKTKSEADQYSLMMKENSTFKKEVVSYHQKLLKHKEELKRAKREIEKLNAKNNESDLQIAQMEKSLNRNKEEALKLYRQNQSLLADFERRQINQLKIASIPDESSSSSISSHDPDGSYNDQEYCKQINYSECQNKLLHDFQEIKVFCTSLRDENCSLKNEIRYLREKLKFAKSHYQREYSIGQNQKYKYDNSFDSNDSQLPSNENIQMMNCKYNIRKFNDQGTFNHSQINYIPNNNQQINQSIPKEFILDPTSKSIISRCMNNFLIKMELLNSKTLSKLDHLLLKWNSFETSLKQATSYRKEKIHFRSLTCNNNSNNQFISNLNRELRIIDTLARCFAKDHNIPSYAIPSPQQLIGDSVVLGEFLERKGQPKFRKNKR